MKTVKQDVIDFLVNLPEKDNEKFNKAFELYRNSDGKNFSQERFLNKVGFTTTSLATVVYELKKIHKISDSEIRKALKELELSGLPAQKSIDDLITLLLQLPEEDKNDILLSYKINSEIASEENPLSEKLNTLVEKGKIKFASFIESNEELHSILIGNEEVSSKEIVEALDKITAEFEFPEELKEEIEAYSTLNIKVNQPKFVGTPEFPSAKIYDILVDRLGLVLGDTDECEFATLGTVLESGYPYEISNEEREVVKSRRDELKIKLDAIATAGESANQAEENTDSVVNPFATAQPIVKEAIKFRDEFPFLKDEDCPAELKALVTDKFTAYYEFCDAHQELFEKVVAPAAGEKLGDNAVIFELAKKAVDNFEADQAIYNELAHYKAEKKILGKHPVFAKRKIQEEVEKLSIADAAKRAANLDNYIRRDSNKAEAAKTTEEKEKFLQKVEAWKQELHYIKLKLEK